MIAPMKALRGWLRRRRFNRLRIRRAELQGRLDSHRAAGYEAPGVQGRLAGLDEKIRQLVEES